MKRGLLAVLLVTGCVESQAGDGGALRFGLQVDYEETEGFTAPIARGQRMPIAIQAASKNGLLNEYAYLKGTLTATSLAGVNATVAERDVGKFDAVFDTVDQYTLKASTETAADTLNVTVAEQDSLRFGLKREVTTKDTSKSCTHLPGANESVLLQANQTLWTQVIPVTADGAPMLGVLEFDVTSTTLDLERNLKVANEYSVRLKPGVPDGIATARFVDRLTGQSVDLTVDVTSALAVCP